jgi:predicted lipid-binding transport protein (Tim44 family)
MAPTSSPLDAFARAVSRVLGTLFGLLLALAGFVLMLGLLAIGLAAALGLTLWALLRGRRPTLQAFRWRSTGFRRGFRGMGEPPTRQRRGEAPSEVVDVEAIEVRDASRRDGD